MDSHRIMVLGAGGQLGRSLELVSGQFPDFNFLFFDRCKLDLCDSEHLARTFERHRISACVNAAAYTAVDRAETDQEAVHRVNVLGPANLAKRCLEHQVLLVHISTDYVYAANSRPLTESDPTHPLNVYAATKLEGEQLVRSILPESLIVRTSWVYAPWGHNFLQTMRRLGRERTELRVVYDQVGTPTYAPDLAAAILTLLRRQLSEHPAPWGVYNYSNEGVCSWYDFAQAIIRLEQVPCKVYPILTEEYPTPAKRPAYSVLDKRKIRTNFGLEIDHWHDRLQACLQEYPFMAY
jgi:dTDP-4-dehydrorhamnose reductase